MVGRRTRDREATEDDVVIRARRDRDSGPAAPHGDECGRSRRGEHAHRLVDGEDPVAGSVEGNDFAGGGYLGHRVTERTTWRGEVACPRVGTGRFDEDAIAQSES